MSEGSTTSKSNGGLAKTESMEMRWALKDEEGSSDELDESIGRSSFEEEDDDDDDDSEHQRLVRTGPRVDSFDVEALEVHGFEMNGYEEESSCCRSIVLALQTLGVVFGDVGTSPLYTFDIMFNKYPVTKKEDVLGALSLVLYTLILIPLLKYVLIVLWGNDDGEGGIFALYSVICRYAKASLLPNQLPSDQRISSFRLKVPSPELERSLKIKETLETSSILKKLLLILVLLGISMIIVDGVATPAMSVMSAVNGFKVGLSSVNEGEVVMITVAFLVVLFSIQRFGTSKVGLALGPALFIWFCCLAGIGIYNLINYGYEALRAFNPVYIYRFFKSNPSQAWLSLGGCLLCATGSEAMFADLCYFSVKSVQFTFILLVLPCLILGYLGQAAFLLENLTAYEQVFFLSIPSRVFWPVMCVATIASLIASRAMTTAIFSIIKQATALQCFPRLKIIHTSRKFMGQIYIPVVNWLLLVSCLAFVLTFGSINEIGNAYGIAEVGVMIMTTILVTVIMLLIWQINIVLVLSFFTLVLGIELLFFSSLLANVVDGSWVLLVFAFIVFLVMYIWNYGSKLKYETEVKQKLSMDFLLKLGCNLGTVRAPGIGLLYNELVRGVPAIFGHFLTTLPAVHSMVIFVCIKYVPVPVVPQSERFLFRRVGPKNYHMFRCIARYGYKDVRKENHQAFEQLLIDSLEKFIRREAQELLLESDHYDSDTDSDVINPSPPSCSRYLVDPNGGLYSLSIPLFQGEKPPLFEPSTSFDEVREDEDVDSLVERELSFVHKAKESGVVYLLGHGDIRARKDSWFVKKLVINYFYAFFRKNCRRGIETLNVPHTKVMQVAMTYMV
ncbi:Potassium transporter [Rhynchospora pubera]|uniref:Potassium transporter n=1 Tax=Rhynchospora pubera TaxID=906938 RepID=A0AAV8G8D7_9POAL|nr:Potassium transporter [Rhynchospora pubera]